MSSDTSNDVDEDELLQIALKEQAERDINYHRPPFSSSSSKTAPSKPVVNLVQHPQSSLSNNHRKFPNHTTTANSRRGGRPQDDDDSDVELLSISSGDDDSFSDRRFAQNFTGGPATRRGGGDNIRGDRRWNSDEPDSWKRVDEGELGRRVREMRETRAAPVTQDLERKGSTLSHKGLTNLQSLSRGREFVDPLGLGIIDIKSLTLTRDASESSPVSVDKPEKDILDPSAYEKLLYYSEQFDAKLFLSRIHQDTSAADLESGALVLKSDLKGRTQQRKQLVKENFDCFVSCKTTIDDIRSKLKRIEEDPEGAGTAHLYHAIHDVSLLANRAFEPLFERQVQAEKIRSVQGILQRFRTLFNLPSAIRGNISKGEYDLAVREYRKAKSIVLPSHVGILRSVLEEVEKVMQEFKGMLYKSLEESQLELAELENTIWLLLDLEPELDPVWHYLNIQDRRIRGLLEKCTLNYEEQMEVLHGEMQERVLSDKRWKLSQQDSNKAADVVYSLLGDNHLPVDSPLVDTTGEVDALRGRCIFWLTAVLINHLPAFWRLAVSMLTGKFLKSSHASGNMLVGPEATVKAANCKTEDSVSDVKYTSHSLDEVAEMVDGIISTYETKVHNVFRDFEPSNILRPYMSDAIKEISKACQVLKVKESAPASAVKILQCLHMDITKIYILSLCSWMHATTKEIAKDELWVPVSVLERNNSPYTISFMPLAFCSVTISAMDQIMEMVENLRIDAMKTNDMFVQVQEIQESIRISFLNCFLDFVGCLEQIGSGLSLSNASKETAHLCNGSLQENEVKSILAASVIADSHQKLLMVLSNVGYCKDQVVYDLYNKYKLIWLQSGGKGEGDSDIQDLVSSFAALEEKVLEQYTYAKASLIRTAAFNYLLDSGILWGGVPSVKGIRDAAVELLHVLVAVHAEVFAGAKPMLEKILGTLVEGLIDTFLSLFHEHGSKELKSLDANGFCQLMLELEYFETVLSTYFTPDAREALKSLQGLLLDKASNSMVESSENPGHHRRPTRGSEEAFVDDRQQGITMSPDDLIVLAQHHSSELLNTELERTRINIACFMEPSDSVPEIVKPPYSSFRGSLDFSSRNHRVQPGASPSFSRQRRR